MKCVQKNLIAGLIEIGLSEKEALLYQAALKCGPATAQILSIESSIKRATVYACIETLIQLTRYQFKSELFTQSRRRTGKCSYAPVHFHKQIRRRISSP